MRPLTRFTIFGVRLATVVLVLYWTALFIGTHMPSPPKVRVSIANFDKVQHFTAFFGLAFLLCWVIPSRPTARRKFALVGVIAIAYAAFDEFTQGFVPTRQRELNDFVANAVGVFAAIAVYATLRWLLIDRIGSPSSPSIDIGNHRQDDPEGGADSDHADRPRARSADQDSIKIA